jgi:F like protein
VAPSNGARIVPLGGIARAISQVFRQPKDKISDIDPGQQFGPLQPFVPIGGDSAEPWISQIQPGQNLTITPRSREQYDSNQLRSASMYDLARIIIENVEDQVSRLELNVRLKRLPGESGKDYAKRKPDQGILREIDARLTRPNANQHRSQFIRQLLDDMLVGDFASVLKRRTRKRDIYDFRAIDGSQILRYFDSWGGTPMPPDPAYAQIWDAGASGGHGIPWIDLTTDQLNYAMRNLKTYRLYGMSPVEQAINILITGDLRLQFQNAYYTHGSIPDAMQVVPTKITDSQFKEAQKVLNAELEGVLTKRRNIRLIQGFNEDSSKEQFIFPKAELLKDEFDDYVIRVLCYCFGTSPQRLQRVMGMRSGQVNQNAAEKEGLEPWLDWAGNCIWNPMVIDLGFPQYEATYQEDTDVDPEKQAVIDKSDVSVGIRTPDEVREDRGLPPYENGIGDQPVVITGTGAIPLGLDAQVAHAKNMAEALPQPEPAPGGPKKKVEKRHKATIDPGHETPARRHARARLEAACSKVFRRQREKAGEEATRLLKKVRKADDSKDIADKIFAAIESEFRSLPPDARVALEQAALSGINDAWLQIEITDSDVIAGANVQAAEYASERAAELVGMKYNADGELVANPSAKWAISETTRDRLREIIRNAFEDKTPFSEIISDIQDADIFSEERAAMIARTEISRAQVQANLSAWKKTGLVSRVKWLAVGPDPCRLCEENDGEIRDIGTPFPTGVTMPLQHPNCYCILEAVLDTE